MAFGVGWYEDEEILTLSRAATLHTNYQGFSVAMMPVFVFGLMCDAVVLTWIYNHTGSVLAVAAWHGIYNVTGATKAATGASGAIASAMWTFVVVNAIVLLVLERRASDLELEHVRHRRRRRRHRERGQAFPASEFLDRVVEHQMLHSAALHATLDGRRYLSGPGAWRYGTGGQGAYRRHNQLRAAVTSSAPGGRRGWAWRHMSQPVP
jgi:hypothetical protein